MVVVFFGLLKQGDRIVGHRCLYAGANMWLDEDLHQWGIDTERVDMRDLDALREALKKPTRVVYFEPYANASMDFVDVKAVIDLAHNFSMKVVAEGVESMDIVERLKDLGCDILQGYVFDRPLEVKTFEASYGISKALPGEKHPLRNHPIN